MPIVTRRAKSTPSIPSRKPWTKCWRDCSPSVTTSMPAASCSLSAASTASRLPSASAAPARLHGPQAGRDDGVLLFETNDLLGVGRMADHAKSRREGDRVYFVINRYISPTNVCVLSCAFCGFARKPGQAGAFEYTIEDIVGMVKDEIREVHIVGGHHPDWPFEYYERIIAALHAARPDVQIKAFTAAEIDYFCRRWK